MKKYLLSILLLSTTCLLNTYGNESTSIGPVIEMTFYNSTHTDVHINISEIITINPYLDWPIKEISLTPGQLDSIPISLAIRNDTKRTLKLITEGSGEEYSKGGSLNLIEVDIAESNTFTVRLNACWIYPGDGFFGLDPFIHIGTRLIKAN